MTALRRLDVSGCGCPSGRLELPSSLQGLTQLAADGMHGVGVDQQDAVGFQSMVCLLVHLYPMCTGLAATTGSSGVH